MERKWHLIFLNQDLRYSWTFLVFYIILTHFIHPKKLFCLMHVCVRWLKNHLAEWSTSELLHLNHTRPLGCLQHKLANMMGRTPWQGRTPRHTMQPRTGSTGTCQHQLYHKGTAATGTSDCLLQSEHCTTLNWGTHRFSQQNPVPLSAKECHSYLSIKVVLNHTNKGKYSVLRK